MEQKSDKKINTQPSVTAQLSFPDDSIELVNKYGTYEIQPTADTTNEFPTIAQGLAKKEKEKYQN